MFGSYCVCNIIVLLNMLIAMMSNSYQVATLDLASAADHCQQIRHGVEVLPLQGALTSHLPEW